jgi:acyl-CoA thioester hydrolase
MEKEADAFLPVTECRVTYRQPARYDEELRIRSRIITLRSRAISFAYEVRRASDDVLLAEGETHHIVMNSAGRARAFPPKYAELMQRQPQE